MVERLQWVNFPQAEKTIRGTQVIRAKFVDADIASVDDMSSTVYLAVKLKDASPGVRATLTLEPNGANARYSVSEKSAKPGLFAPGRCVATKVGINGVARFKARLTPAGGDRFAFKAKSSKGTEVALAEEIETRRKLFYQIIRMQRATALGATARSRFEKRFWSDAKKIYIKMEELSPGRTIANMANFDDTKADVLRKVRNAARAVYDRSKAPFSVAVVTVNKNCIPKQETGAVPVVFNGGAYHLGLRDRLFYYADPNVRWFYGMTFICGVGALINIPRAAVTMRGMQDIEIDTSALPRGPGVLTYDIKVVDIEGMGLSLPTENLVTVACRDLDGARVNANTMAAVLTHEVGHKVGMVPGPQGDPDLDQQSSYYHGRGHFGPHCRRPAPLVANYSVVNPVPAPKCTMFGDTRTNTSVFCSKCQESLRKLDVNPERKVGLAKQF